MKVIQYSKLDDVQHVTIWQTYRKLWVDPVRKKPFNSTGMGRDLIDHGKHRFIQNHCTARGYEKSIWYGRLGNSVFKDLSEILQMDELNMISILLKDVTLQVMIGNIMRGFFFISPNNRSTARRLPKSYCSSQSTLPNT